MTDGEPETVVSASLQKIKSIKNPIKHYYFKIFFYFIKSETSDSFVNHFDGHFAYLKTLDFYFKVSVDVRHHAYLLTLDQEEGGAWSWVLITGWIALLLTEPSRDQEQGGG